MATWNFSEVKRHLLICNGSSCNRKGGEEVTQAIRAEITAQGLDDVIHTTRTRCNGRCKDACVVISYPTGDWYRLMDENDGKELVRELLTENPLPHKKAIEYRDGLFSHVENDDVPEGIFKRDK